MIFSRIKNYKYFMQHIQFEFYLTIFNLYSIFNYFKIFNSNNFLNYLFLSLDKLRYEFIL